MVDDVKARYGKSFFQRLMIWTAVWGIMGGINGFFVVGGANGVFGGLFLGGISGAIGVLVGSFIAAIWLIVWTIGGVKRQTITWGIIGLSIGLILFILMVTDGADDAWILGPFCVVGGAISGAIWGLTLGLTLVKVIEWGMGDENRERIIVWGVAGAFVGAAVFGIINSHGVIGVINEAVYWVELIVGFLVGALIG